MSDVEYFAFNAFVIVFLVALTIVSMIEQFA